MIFKSSDFIKMNKQVGESGELINKEMLESVLSSFFYYDDLVEQVASIYRGLAKTMHLEMEIKEQLHYF